MAGDGFVRMSEGPERWVRDLGNGFEIKVPYVAEDRQRLAATIKAGLRFNSPQSFAGRLVSIRDYLCRVGLSSALRISEFHEFGSELVVAARAPRSDAVALVTSAVEGRVSREIRKIRQAAFHPPFSEDDRQVIEELSSEDQDYYFNAPFHDWVRGSEYRRGEKAVEPSIDRLIYLRRIFWVELASVLGFRFLNGKFIDDLAPQSSEVIDPNWFGRWSESVADTVDVSTNADWVDSMHVNSRALSRVAGLNDVQGMLVTAVKWYRIESTQDRLMEAIRWIRSGDGSQWSIRPPNFGANIVVPLIGGYAAELDVDVRESEESTHSVIASDANAVVASGENQAKSNSKDPRRRIEFVAVGEGYELQDSAVGLVAFFNPSHLGGQMLRAAILMERDKPVDLVKIRRKILNPSEDVGFEFPVSLVEEFALTPARGSTRGDATKSDPRELSIQIIRQPLVAAKNKGMAFESTWLLFDRANGLMTIRSVPHSEPIRPTSE